MGVGTPEQARAFRVLSGFAGPMIVDTDRRTHAALELRRASLFSLLRPRMFRAALAARREGFRQGRTQGDPWQLGGTAVVAPGDRLLYLHRDAGPEDEAPLDDVIAAATGGRG